MLHIHRAERADGLIQALRALMLDPLDDPFAQEVVAVPTRGMERWLTQRMSECLGATPGRSDGVCANVDFPSPRRLVNDAVAAASGIEAGEDPWLPERAVWPLLEVVDECVEEPWLHSLAAHLGRTSDEPDEIRQARRFSSVRHLTELFDRYALYRPEMLLAWRGGKDTAGAKRPLPPESDLVTDDLPLDDCVDPPSVEHRGAGAWWRSRQVGAGDRALGRRPPS